MANLKAKNIPKKNTGSNLEVQEATTFVVCSQVREKQRCLIVIGL